MREYHWRGTWSLKSYAEKIKRAAAQFTPYNWTPYHWGATQSLKRWLTTLLIIGMVRRRRGACEAPCGLRGA